ncbi:DUF302 domain-containing protein [Phaeobacter sp. B1627]|uniref:DUF302 domain-containing protein n=1 Tax=Phaeobacter sp. B1627 TaxID=2583809 RepID=UPI001118AC44|nr:DUF302 domain-containing protein [Phaeobacter sp. B1627]
MLLLAPPAFIATPGVIVPPAFAANLQPREGWSIQTSDKGYAALLRDLKSAVKTAGMGLVTEAGPTGAAAARGIILPGNRVLGVFRNDFAVAILALSTAAMIEAPVRIYVTEAADGRATLSYKTPTHVFAPYMAEAGPDLATLAAELDTIFAEIAGAALR